MQTKIVVQPKTSLSLFVFLAVFLLITLSTSGATVNATYNSATDIPVTANGYTASGNTVNFTLNFVPAYGTDLIVVKNTARQFINGTFENLAQGQAVRLTYGGNPYNFVANYYGGSGHDLVLLWAGPHSFMWGRNKGTNVPPYIEIPTAMQNLGVLGGKTISQMAVGDTHCIALCVDGTVAAWGVNNVGQLGNGANTSFQTTVPVAVSTSGILSNKTVVAISTSSSGGTGSNLALCSDGSLVAWGDDGNYQLGDAWNGWPYGSDVPVAVSVNTNSALYNRTVVAIASGVGYCLALCSDGVLVAWGMNSEGQLGDGTSYYPPYGRALALAVGTNSALVGKDVISIAAGGNFNLALCSDGTVVGWGENREGELGDGSGIIQPLPVAVSTSGVLSNKTVVAIASGAIHSIALCSDGTLVSWGYNAWGQLGNGTTINSYVPVLVTTAGVLSNKTVIKIACGVGHSMALCSDGTLFEWGWNLRGQLGNGEVPYTSMPMEVVNTNLETGERFCSVFSGNQSENTLALVGSSTAPQPIKISKLGVGAARMIFMGVSGFDYDIEASTNLLNWDLIGTFPAETNGQFQITDTNVANFQSRFFRGNAH